MFFKQQEHIDKLSDTDLISQYKETLDNKYVGELYTRYAHLVLGLCIKYFKNETHAQDAVMNIFEQILTDLQKHEVEFFKSWLYTVAKNHCLQVLRKDQTQVKKSDEFKSYVKNSVESDEILHLNDTNEKEKMLQQLEKVLPELKENQRECVSLFYLEEKSYIEIAEQTGYTLNEVKSNIQNGKRNLKIKMDNLNE